MVETTRPAAPAGIGAKRRAAATVLGAVILAVALGACAPKTALRGNLPRAYQLEQIEVGQQRKQEVARILGSPSTAGAFDDSVWYYISRRTETWAFFGEDVIEQQVLALYFDERGVLQHMETYTQDDARDIAASDRTTPTAGRELGFFEQIFGNLGRGIGGVTN